MAVLGIDEVGRGPWAGPLVAGAVVLREPVNGLRDSKKLTAKKRTVLDQEIRSHGFVGLGWVRPEEIDRLGMTSAVKLAMLRAVKDVHSQGGEYDKIVIDGSYNFLQLVRGLQCSDEAIMTMVKADNTVPEVSAASIVAKVARDNYMKEIATEYPEYGFDAHVGYGTKVHHEALKQFGITPEHRRSFKPIAKLIAD